MGYNRSGERRKQKQRRRRREERRLSLKAQEPQKAGQGAKAQN